MGSQICARQMDRSVAAFESGGVSHRLRTVRVPLDFENHRIGVGTRRPPDQEDDLVSIAKQTLSKSPSHEAGSAAHQNLPNHLRVAAGNSFAAAGLPQPTEPLKGLDAPATRDLLCSMRP